MAEIGRNRRKWPFSRIHYQGKGSLPGKKGQKHPRNGHLVPKMSSRFSKKKKVVNYPITWASIGPDSEPPKFWPPDFPWAFRRQTPPLVVYRGTSRDPGKSGKSGKTAVFRKSGHFFNFRVISSDFRVIFKRFIAWFIAIYSVFWRAKTRLKSLCASLIIFGKTSPLEMLFLDRVWSSAHLIIQKPLHRTPAKTEERLRGH